MEEQGKKRPKAIICDIDGTLANIDHRRHHVEGDKKNWEAFFSKMDQDIPNPPVLDILHAYCWRGKHQIVLLTGRPSDYQAVTSEWLNKYEVPWGTLLMRDTGDRRPDFIVKKELYLKHIHGVYNVTFVLDDRNSVVKMWRDLGLTCLQVAEGDF